MDNTKEESAAIEKLYEYGEHLSESSDKSKVSLAQTFLRPPKKKSVALESFAVIYVIWRGGLVG
jgi:hypothetical protein